MPEETTYKLFGAVNFSFLHSKKVAGIFNSFDIEVKECASIFKEEIKLPELEMIIFTGRYCLPLFIHYLWKEGTEITLPESEELTKVDPNATVCTATLVTDQEVTFIFTRHLSPRCKFPADFPTEFSKWLGSFVS
jgi:uracil-DNA glycosylase